MGKETLEDRLLLLKARMAGLGEETWPLHMMVCGRQQGKDDLGGGTFWKSHQVSSSDLHSRASDDRKLIKR